MLKELIRCLTIFVITFLVAAIIMFYVLLWLTIEKTSEFAIQINLVNYDINHLLDGK